jgi:hypothetical protein
VAIFIAQIEQAFMPWAKIQNNPRPLKTYLGERHLQTREIRDELAMAPRVKHRRDPRACLAMRTVAVIVFFDEFFRPQRTQQRTRRAPVTGSSQRVKTPHKRGDRDPFYPADRLAESGSRVPVIVGGAHTAAVVVCVSIVLSGRERYAWNRRSC